MDKKETKKFNSKLYYQLNKEKINKYNKLYWVNYYPTNKLKIQKNLANKPHVGIIIKQNVLCTFG